MKLEDIHLDDPATFGDGIPHEAFAVLRRDAPLWWDAGSGYWSVTRHRDVAALSRDPEHFSSEPGVMAFDQPELAPPEAPRMMIEMDPPRHTRYRLLVNRGFTPRLVTRLTGRIEEGAATIIDDARRLGSCDFVSAIASPLPLRIIADLLGVPEEDRLALFKLSNRIMGHEDEEYGAEAGAPYQAIGEMFAYATELLGQRQSAPQVGEGLDPSDILGTLLSQLDGDQLTEEEFRWFFLLLVVAGNETTRTALSQGLLAFFQNPDQWERLLADPALLEPAVEEVLRWSTPILHFRRTATADIELHGQTIRRHDKVVLWYASANFDDDVFVDPLRFDIARSPNEHVTFGAGGPHFCLGAHLARLELKVMLDGLTRCLPHLHLDGSVERLASNWTNGVKRMPVAF